VPSRGLLRSPAHSVGQRSSGFVNMERWLYGIQSLSRKPACRVDPLHEQLDRGGLGQHHRRRQRRQRLQPRLAILSLGGQLHGRALALSDRPPRRSSSHRARSLRVRALLPGPDGARATARARSARVERSDCITARADALRHGLRRTAGALDRPGQPSLSPFGSYALKANDGRKPVRAETAP